MKLSFVAAAVGAFFLAFSVGFAWLVLRGPVPPEPTQTAQGRIPADEDGSSAVARSPVASLSETFADGTIEAEIHLGRALTYRIYLSFVRSSGSAISAGARPTLLLTMADMHMDGLEPALEIVGPGEWRASGKLPMAGRWVVSAGFGDEFAEAIVAVK